MLGWLSFWNSHLESPATFTQSTRKHKLCIRSRFYFRAWSLANYPRSRKSWTPSLKDWLSFWALSFTALEPQRYWSTNPLNSKIIWMLLNPGQVCTPKPQNSHVTQPYTLTLLLLLLNHKPQYCRFWTLSWARLTVEHTIMPPKPYQQDRLSSNSTCQPPSYYGVSSSLRSRCDL